MSINIERYVQITSGVIGAQAVAQRELVGLRFTSDPRVPVDAIVTMDEATDAVTYFGAGSDEALFAAQYFSYVSPAPASRAPRLRFAQWPSAAIPPRVYGVDANTLITEFTAITDGYLNLTMGAYSTELTGIDLSSAGTLAGVASAMQAAIQAESSGGAVWTAATVSFDAVAGTFNLEGGATGAADIEIAAAAAGTDLSMLLGWRNTGTIFSPGSAEETPLEAFIRVENITDSFGSVAFGPSMTEVQASELANIIASRNVKYQFYVPVTSANVASFHAALLNVQSTGLIFNGTTGEFKESIPMAIMAATNYQRQNATVNYMFRQVSGMTADVATDTVADSYDTMRVSYYGETASAGQKIAFFQRGFLQGVATSPLDMNVHANEQWLKAFLTARLLSIQISVGRIPANNEGRGIVLAVVNEGVTQGKFNGTIILGKILTTAQQIAITSLTGDPDAWREVQTNGFWVDCQIVTRTGESGATEYVAQYTLAYSKNDVVRKIEGSHNLI